jgi:RNA polymerase sigma factor (sigma-70 family)
MADRVYRVTEGPDSPPAVLRVADSGSEHSYATEFERLFREYHARLFGHIHRLCGEPDLAADIVQEAFVRLYRRGSAPDSVVSWLLTVALNLLRNAQSQTTRRRELLSVARDVEPAESGPDVVVMKEERARVREALSRLSERDRQLLSLMAGGFTYREMAAACGLNEASVGTLLARAKRAFREHYGADDSAP